MIDPKDIKPGGPVSDFTATDYNDLIDKIRGSMDLQTAPPLFRLGNKAGLSRRDGFWARLSGATSPYSWTRMVAVSPGSFSIGTQTGTTNAYEVNAAGSLGDQIAWLVPGAADDYRFQWVESGIDFRPECVCWNLNSLPATLSWTLVSKCRRAIDGVIVTLGTTSGTLVYEDPISITDGVETCTVGSQTIFDPSTPIFPVSGWVDEYTYYTGAGPASLQDCSIVTFHDHPEFIDDQFGARNVYRWLIFTCAAFATLDSNDLSKVVVMTDTITDCTDGSYVPPNSGGGGTVTIQCNPFIYTVTGGDGSILTITE